MDPLALARASRRFPTIGALFLAGAAGIVTWFFLNAEVFTLLQRYYWNEYLNTEMYQGARGDYRVLEVVTRQGSHSSQGLDGASHLACSPSAFSSWSDIAIVVVARKVAGGSKAKRPMDDWDTHEGLRLFVIS